MVKRKNKKDPNFIRRAWDRYYKHPEIVKFNKEDKDLRVNAILLSEFKKLKTEFPLGDKPPSGSKCRQLFFPNKRAKDAWLGFCSKWDVQLRPLIWGNIQKNSPGLFSMKVENGRVIKEYFGSPTEQQLRAFLPIELLYTQMTFGQHKPDSGRKEDIARNRAIRREYKLLVKKSNLNQIKEYLITKDEINRTDKIRKSELIVTYLCKKYKLSEGRTCQIAYSRKYD